MQTLTSPPEPPPPQFIHFRGIGCLRLSDIAGWWWLEEGGLDIGLRDKRCLTIEDPEKARAAEIALLAALGLSE